MELILIFWILFSIGVGYLANERGRNGFGWVLLAIITSPLLGLVIVLLTRDLKVEAANQIKEEMRHREQLAALTGIKETTADKYYKSGATWVRTNAEKAPLERSFPMLVADEIEKLASLKDRGFLTPEEFLAQKARLLSTKQTTNEVTQRHNTELAAPADKDFASPSACLAILSELGCEISNTGESKWEILQPTEIIFYAYSKNDLENFTRRYYLSRTVSTAA